MSFVDPFANMMSRVLSNEIKKLTQVSVEYVRVATGALNVTT
jgi:hypothetical protein